MATCKLCGGSVKWTRVARAKEAADVALAVCGLLIAYEGLPPDAPGRFDLLLFTDTGANIACLSHGAAHGTSPNPISIPRPSIEAWKNESVRLIAEGRAAHPEVFADDALAHNVEQQVHNLIVENGR